MMTRQGISPHLACLAFLLAGGLVACGGDPPPFQRVVDAQGAPPDLPGTRVAVGDLITDGFELRDGQSIGFVLDVPANAVLHMTVGVIGRAHLLVLVDGEEREVEVFGWTSLSESEGRRRNMGRAVVHLGSGEGTIQLTFEAHGGMASVHAPLVADPTWVVRAMNGEQFGPDVFLFLADTFRADNLSAYGGTQDVTPHLDRFAGEGALFADTLAPACWTLPSHASLFLGLSPYQHGAVRHGVKPDASLPALAERMREAGYRTAAITDSLYVSRAFGLDRGFEWFEEHPGGNLEQTLAAVQRILAADDGRPLFLFVQTYRTHEPYRVNQATFERHGQRLGIDSTWDGLKQEIEAAYVKRVTSGDGTAQKLLEEGDVYGLIRELDADLTAAGTSRSFAERLRSLYLGGVIDLDDGFARFVSMVGEDGIVAFTSDHGEGFGEHGVLFHGRGWWEEILRVPLILRGPGISPGARSTPASLVDLPRTLCALAGIKPHPAWGGRDLMEAGAAGTIWAFDCAQRGQDSAIAVEGGLKLVFPATREGLLGAEVIHAYDLRADPGEERDLALDLGAEGDRIGDVAARLVRDALGLIESRAPISQADLDAADLELFQAMGYAGKGD